MIKVMIKYYNIKITILIIKHSEKKLRVNFIWSVLLEGRMRLFMGLIDHKGFRGVIVL